MRNFTVAVMILILFLSITFAIFKPMPAQEKPKNTDIEEKTYVEKLVTEPNATINTNKEQVFTYSNEIQNNTKKIEFQHVKKEQASSDENVQQKVRQKTSDTDKIEIPQNTNRNFENISQELANKYHNDPKAVVSDEDFNYFMQKMIEQSIQK